MICPMDFYNIGISMINIGILMIDISKILAGGFHPGWKMTWVDFGWVDFVYKGAEGVGFVWNI